MVLYLQAQQDKELTAASTRKCVWTGGREEELLEDLDRLVIVRSWKEPVIARKDSACVEMTKVKSNVSRTSISHMTVL
jgi:hypothetical protein